MANEQMRYRYTRAFIVEGLLAREGQEIVLSRRPDEGRRFMLTGAPDSLLVDADKAAAMGLIMPFRITVAGGPPAPALKPLAVIAGEIRVGRKKLLEGRMVLVCQFEGTPGAVTGGPVDKEGERFLILQRGAIDQITAEHEKDIDRALASLFAADASVVRFEPLGESFRMIMADGSERLAVGLGGAAWGVVRSYVDAEREVKLRNGFERCFRSGKDLKTVTRLLSDSLSTKENKLKSFVSAWTSLEVFINKFCSKRPKPPEEETTPTEKIPALIYRFNSAAENLGLEQRAEKEAGFKEIKAVRDGLFHYGEDVRDSSLPIEVTQNLIRAFLEKIE